MERRVSSAREIDIRPPVGDPALQVAPVRGGAGRPRPQGGLRDGASRLTPGWRPRLGCEAAGTPGTPGTIPSSGSDPVGAPGPFS